MGRALTYVGSRRKGTRGERTKILETEDPRLGGAFSFREKGEEEEFSEPQRRDKNTHDRCKHPAKAEGVFSGWRVAHPQGYGEWGGPFSVKRGWELSFEGSTRKGGAFIGGTRC